MDKIFARGRNVINFSAYRQRTHSQAPVALIPSPNYCSHCGAWLAEGESEDECSTLDARPAFRATGV